MGQSFSSCTTKPLFEDSISIYLFPSMIQPLCDSYVEVTSSNAAQRAHLQWASRCHKVAKHLDPWNTLGTEDCALLAESYYRQLGL